MRNRNKINQLGRTASHRDALLMNLANSLIAHKRISTTVAKAKALRGYVEPLITKSKDDSTHSRRLVFSQLKNKEAVTELFRTVGPKVGERPGGYTRIIKTGFRAGDSAEMCMIELVDFNEIYTSEEKVAAKKTRRSRRGTGAAGDATTAKATPAEKPAAIADSVVEEAEIVEPEIDEAPKSEASGQVNEPEVTSTSDDETKEEEEEK